MRAVTTRERLSVALCTYNGARHLGAQLRSLAEQTRLPDELVVCDDGSTDTTAELVRAFASEAPFPVRLYVNEKNLGSTTNFARAIARCDGELIALSDQDDVWLPDKLRRCEEALAARPRAHVAFTDALVVNDQLEPLGYTLWDAAGFGAARRERFQRGMALETLLKTQVVTGAAMMFRAVLRDYALPIPPTVVHDGWIALLAAIAGELVPVEEPLMLYRQHATNQIGVRKDGFLARALRTRPAGVPSYLAMARDRFQEAQERSSQHGIGSTRSEALLREATRHIEARTSLRTGRAHRFPSVVRELATGRYFRYSNGFYSAVEDLLHR